MLASMLCMSAAMSSCGTVPRVQALTIPVRDDLRACTRLNPVSQASLPPEAESDEARRAQIRERGFWMARDLDQTAHNAILCAKHDELVRLIDANNGAAR